MDPTRFAALIGDLEQRSRFHPRLYRVQVGLVAALGYVYVAALMLLVLGFIAGAGYLAIHLRGGGAIAAKLALPALGFAYLLLRALWIRLPDAEGIPLATDRFPALATMIERVRGQLDAPRFRRVLLDGDFNAAVAQRPRFGLIGPSVSDLILGLPLMEALSPREFEAVLAHELGHVSRQHGRFGHWIYRIRTTWSRLAGVVEAGGGSGLAALLLGRFLSWYAPFFNAYSFVLARQDEYEADAAAVRVAGRTTAAAALVRIQVLSRFHHERHWGAVSCQLIQGGDLPAPHSAFTRALAGLDVAEAESWLAQAIRRPTDYGDTHPSLGDRLRAIGVGATPTLPPTATETAASALLGPAAQSLASELDERWRAAVQPQLTAALAEREAARKRLQELGASLPAEPEAAWERVQLLERLNRDAEARAAAEALLSAWPDHAPALYFVGRARLSADDSAGIALLERAAALHPAAQPAVQELLFDYHWRHGRREEAEAARGSLVAATDRLETAGRERASMAERPVLVSHDLPADRVEVIRHALARIQGLRAAYLARRIVVELPEMPCYLVGVVPARRWWKPRKADESVRLREQVMAATEWPESTYFILSDSGHARLVRRMRKLGGAGIAGPEAPVASAPAALDPARMEQLRLGLARRRTRRRRLRLALVTGGAAVALLVGWVYQQWRRDVAETPLRQLTVAQVAEQVRGARGRVLILVLYDPERDDGLLVGQLRRWATPLDRSKVDLLALTVGDRYDAQAFFHYYAAEWGVPPLAPLWLEPWQPGALDSTMATLGVRVGATWKVPLVAVIDQEGRVIAQWQGETEAHPVITAAARALTPAPARTASASAPAPSAPPRPGFAAPPSSPANR